MKHSKKKCEDLSLNINELKNNYSKLIEQYGENNPEAIEIKKSLDEAQKEYDLINQQLNKTDEANGINEVSEFDKADGLKATRYVKGEEAKTRSNISSSSSIYTKENGWEDVSITDNSFPSNSRVLKSPLQAGCLCLLHSVPYICRSRSYIRA